jgi:FtsH-binding integral membrane protein
MAHRPRPRGPWKGIELVQSRDNDPLNRTQAPATTSERDQTVETLGGVIESSPPREGFLTGAFTWMFVGVVLSAIAAYFVMTSPELLQTVSDYYLLVAIGGLGLAFGIMFLAPRISPVLALGLFFVYAVMMGLVIGVIVYGFTYDPTAPGNISASGMSGVVSAFLGASGIFAGAAVYGYATKRDLTSLGGILFMGLIGLIVVMIAQIFLFPGNSLMNLAIGIGGVIIFTGLTAWDVQKLKNGQMGNINKESATVMGALMLYLDFINLFLFMLRIFGSSR